MNTRYGWKEGAMATIDDVMSIVASVAGWHELMVEPEPEIVHDGIAYEIELVTTAGVTHKVRLPFDVVRRAEDGIAVVTIMERARLFAMVACCPVTRVLAVGADEMVTEVSG